MNTIGKHLMARKLYHKILIHVYQSSLAKYREATIDKNTGLEKYILPADVKNHLIHNHVLIQRGYKLILNMVVKT